VFFIVIVFVTNVYPSYIIVYTTEMPQLKKKALHITVLGDVTLFNKRFGKNTAPFFRI
jgi:hypothetical protein